MNKSASLFLSLVIPSNSVSAFQASLQVSIYGLNQSVGFEGCDVVRAKNENMDRLLLLMRFRTEDELNDWTTSDRCRQFLDKISEMSSNGVSSQRAYGLQTWFETSPCGGSRPIHPPFYKRWAISILAVYPGLLLLLLVTEPLFNGIPKPISIFIVVAFMTGIMTLWIMPFLQRRLGRWLSAK